MSDSDAVLASFVEGVFTCAKCGREAARVSVRPPGVTDPSHLSEIGYFLGHARVVIEAGRLGTTMGGEAVDDAIPEVLRALAAGDAPALFAADFEMAPFWCPTCRASYCDK